MSGLDTIFVKNNMFIYPKANKIIKQKRVEFKMKLTEILVVGIIIVCVFGSGCLEPEQEKPAEILPEPVVKSPEPDKAKDVMVGYGWSVKDGEKEAVNEAVSSALKEFGKEIPEYAVLFTTVGYDNEEVLKEVRRLLPTTRIHGGTSMFGVYTRDGYHIGEKGSLTIMLVSSPKIDFGVGGAEVDGLSAKEAGKQAILAAIKDAGREGEHPKLVYMMGSFNNEEGLLAGIEEVLGKEAPVVGGSAFDDDASGKWRQFANGDIYVNGVVLTVFYTDLKIGWAYESGYEKTEHRGIITKAGGRTIYEIDNRPALEVYDEWTGGLVSEVSAGSNEDVIIEIPRTALYPIAKIMSGKHREIHYVPMHPYFWDMKNKSITLGVNANVGEEVTVMLGTWERNLHHCQATTSKALLSKNIEKDEAYFAIYSYCLGKMLTIPEEERAKIPLMFNIALGDTPWVGANTGGEQGHLEGVGNEHGGLVIDVIVFGPEE